MARLHFVKKARKTIRGAGIKKGESYYWWKFRHGGKRVSKTKPRRSALTQSEFYGVMYDAEDDVAAAIEAFQGGGDVADLACAINEAASSVSEQADECDDKASNLESAFPNGCPSLELLQNRAEQARSISDELESAAGQIEGSEPEEGETDEDWRSGIVSEAEGVNWDYE